MISAVIGQLLVAACVVMTGLFGARWHVGFPMWNRVVWGLRASYFPLANRIVLSFTWCASKSTLIGTSINETDDLAQAWFGGQVMKTLLGSMFPSIYRTFISQPREVSSADDPRDEECLPRFYSHGISRFPMFHPLPPSLPSTHHDPPRTL